MEFYIRYLDFLSPTVTFYYKGFLSHSSFVSALLSIISFLIIIGLACYYSLDLIRRQNPTAFYFNSFVDDAGEYPLNASSFFHFISLSVSTYHYKDNGVDFENFRILGFEDYFINYLSNRNLTYYNHWVYGYCNNENDVQGIKHLINYTFFERSACIRKFFDKKDQKYYDTNDPKFRWPTMAHGTFNKNTTFYVLVIERCKEDTIGLVLGNNAHCKTTKEFNKTVGQSSTAHLYYIDNYIDVLNYTNPHRKFFYRVENSLQLNMYPINHLNFNPIFVETNDGLVFDNKKEILTYTYERNDAFVEDVNGTDVYTAYYLWLNNRRNYYKRNYKRIQDIISSIGGVYQIITILSIYINKLYNNYMVLYDTKNLLYNLIHKEKTIHKKNRIHSNAQNVNSITNEITKIENNELKKEKEYKKNKNKKNENENDDTKISSINYLNKTAKISKSNSNLKLDTNTNKKEKNNKNDDRTKNNKNFFDFIKYKLICNKNDNYFQIYNNFRLKILSEEHLIRNHLNIYNLLKIADKKRNFRRNSYQLKDLIKLI